jgi:hypothetical protein
MVKYVKNKKGSGKFSQSLKNIKAPGGLDVHPGL